MDVSLTTDKRVGGSFGLRLRRSLTPLVLALGQHDHVGLWEIDVPPII